MLYLMSIELYYRLSKVNSFRLYNGSTYGEYIIKSTNLPNNLRYSILNARHPEECLIILRDNQIEFTHDYPESINADDNITLTIIDKDVCLVE